MTALHHQLPEILHLASGTTLFGYDAQDNLTSVTDPRSLVTSDGYNGFGDRLTQTSPDTGLTTKTYDWQPVATCDRFSGSLAWAERRALTQP